jgi:uncharacterized protein YndB with AHSA1/START domain
VWKVVGDPHHFPRWWPKVGRVEGVNDDAWTLVYLTKKSKPVRADHVLIDNQPLVRRAWQQELEGTPFERMLREAVTAVELEPAEEGTTVVLEVRQKLRGVNRLGGFLFRGANRRILNEALEGLERVCVR